jgi:nucleoside-diphosphate-sugar epimerase
MPHLLIFGLGYTASRLATRLRGEGWQVTGTSRATLPLDDPHTVTAIASATHILSSVPPGAKGDPVLALHTANLRAAPARWLGYLSSTGVYGDANGAWVDEASPVGGGRRDARTAADLAWQALRPHVRIFRLPGIYGPGRSALDRVAAGTAPRVDAPEGQVFSRIHVDDIVAAVVASFTRGAPGLYNLADDEPASGNIVTEHACDLLGLPYPPLSPIASLSPMAQGFYAENRRVAATKMKRDLGLRLRYPDHRSGLRACLAEKPV